MPLAHESTPHTSSNPVPASLPSLPPSRAAALPQALLEYRLVLMNKQKTIRLGLSHVPHRQYAQGIHITTVGACLPACLRMERRPLRLLCLMTCSLPAPRFDSALPRLMLRLPSPMPSTAPQTRYAIAKPYSQPG